MEQFYCGTLGQQIDCYWKLIIQSFSLWTLFALLGRIGPTPVFHYWLVKPTKGSLETGSEPITHSIICLQNESKVSRTWESYSLSSVLLCSFISACSLLSSISTSFWWLCLSFLYISSWSLISFSCLCSAIIFWGRMVANLSSSWRPCGN